jgi:hypothetical protein
MRACNGGPARCVSRAGAAAVREEGTQATRVEEDTEKDCAGGVASDGCGALVGDRGRGWSRNLGSRSSSSSSRWDAEQDDTRRDEMAARGQQSTTLRHGRSGLMQRAGKKCRAPTRQQRASMVRTRDCGLVQRVVE